MSKRYRLLKDLPNVKAGTVFELNNTGTQYVCVDEMGLIGHFYKETVETKKDWWELIPDTPEQTTKEGFVWDEKIDGVFIEFIKDFGNKELVSELLKRWCEYKASKQSLSNTRKKSVCGVTLDWRIKEHESDLSKVMKPEDCRFIGTWDECFTFILKNEPQSNTPKEERPNEFDIYTSKENNDFFKKSIEEKLKEEQPSKERIEDEPCLSVNDVYSFLCSYYDLKYNIPNHDILIGIAKQKLSSTKNKQQ